MRPNKFDSEVESLQADNLMMFRVSAVNKFGTSVPIETDQAVLIKASCGRFGTFPDWTLLELFLCRHTQWTKWH